MRKFFKKTAFLSLSATIGLTSSTAFATEGHNLENEAPILVLGASWANASSPYFSDLQTPLGGLSVNLGSFLSIGAALSRNSQLSGHVINEAQAGATTFDRLQCNPDDCINVGFEGYNKQLSKAISRVSVPDPNNPDHFLVMNAEYVVITPGNDCVHPGAFGIPRNQTTECTDEEMNASIANIIAVSNRALGYGITPIVMTLPEYHQLDLETFKASHQFPWVISEESYYAYKNIYETRIEEEVPNAIVINAWPNFEASPDGIHQTRETSITAARNIAKAIKKHHKDKN